MRYGQIRRYDIANGTGIRVTIFVTGCTHCCYNCFNEEYQSFEAGQEWTQAETDLVVQYLKDPNVEGLTVLGGEPFQNIEGLLPVLQRVRKEVPYKTIWIYSGYTYDQLIAMELAVELLSLCDILVDGPYVDQLRDPGLAFRGSSNQRLIDLKETRRCGNIVLCNFDAK